MKKNLFILIILLINFNVLTAQTALTFDGVNDFLMGTNNASLNVTQGTLEAWIKTTNAGTEHRGIIVKQYNYGLFLYNNTLEVFEWNGKGIINSNVNLADGVWHHVAFTFSSGILDGSKLYIDGQPVLTFTYIAGTQNYSIVIGAGADNYTLDQYFKGEIDQVRVWNTVRTDAEILANYKNCLSGSEAGLVMLWHFEEGNGSSVVADLSGNSNTGTLLNMDAGAAWIAGYNCNSQPTLIQQANNNRNFSVFNNRLLFNNNQDLNEIKSISVFSITGQKVFHTENITSAIELGSLKKGLYLVRIEKHDKTFSTSKLIFENSFQ
jgi:hypothetical protein